MGLIAEQPPKYIPWKLLQHIHYAIKIQDNHLLNMLRFHMTAEYGIDWERKSLDLKTGQIICLCFNDRNIDRDFRE